MPGRVRHWFRLPLVVAALVAGVTFGAAPASAHTALESSTPADRATVTAPVDVITLTFNEAVSPLRDGYQVLDPQGQIRTPDAVEQPAPEQILLRFTTALSGGEVGVLWSVASDDGHVVSGGLSFTVDAPAPTTVAPATTTTSSTTTTVPPSTTVPSTTTAPARTTIAPEAAVTTAAPTTEPPSSISTSPPTATTSPTTPPITLDEFLGRSIASPTDLTWRRVAQVLGAVASLLAVGWLAFVVVLRPGNGTARTLETAAMGAGLLVSVAAVLEATAQAGLVLDRSLAVIGDPVAVYDALAGDYRLALTLRVVGGLVLATGAAALRRRPGRAEIAVAGLGAAAVVVSFAFDGHTVSKGNRIVQFLADLVHVLAGAWWLGGLVAMGWWAWRRWRRPGAGSDDGFLLALLRFSAYGGWVLLALTLAGGVMALGIVAGPGDLTGTTWGRVLLFKVAATALAVAIAGYHRWVLIPAVRDRPDDPVVRERVTDALAAEAFLVLLAGVLAGVLVGSQI